MKKMTTPFGTRYCLNCQAIVQRCPCINLHHEIYRFTGTDIHTELDIDQQEAEPEPADDLPDLDPYSRFDLDVTAPTCPKNAQHREFVAGDTFSIHSLPPGLWHPTLYVWLRNCIPSVVRIISSTGRLASGRATLIPNELGREMPCSDPECPHRIHGPHMVYGGMGIITNKHVVQDRECAQGTVVEFFYNDRHSRQYTVKKEKGSDIFITNNSMDYTTFSCFVHDKDLLVIIATCDKIRNYAWRNIPQHVRANSKQHAIIISHPHGTAKKVSIGHVIRQEVQNPESVEQQENVNTLRDIYNICEDNNALSRFAGYIRQLPDIKMTRVVTWYDTATCRGSSGAPVFMGNVVMDNGEEINQAHTHRGVDSTMGCNYCFT